MNIYGALIIYVAIVVSLIFYAITRMPRPMSGDDWVNKRKDAKLRREIMDKLNRAIADIKRTV